MKVFLLLSLVSLVGAAVPRIAGRLESPGGGSCGAIRPLIQNVKGKDGFLYPLTLSACGNDTMGALIDTVQAQLDAAAAAGLKVMLAIGQGKNMPPSWLATCETFELQDGRFSGDLCVPWDPSYKANLAAFLAALGARVNQHTALLGVYMTHTMMTNGYEWHFRVNSDAFTSQTSYPGDTELLKSLEHIFDLYAGAFPERAIAFEAAHTTFNSGAKAHWNTAEPVYDYALAKYGSNRVAIAAWNCAERTFISGSDAVMQGLFAKATNDGVAMGCQTIGNFAAQPCRFTDVSVGLDFGPIDNSNFQFDCYGTAPLDPATQAPLACNKTLHWYKGLGTFANAGAGSIPFGGTWLESWSVDAGSTDPVCQAAIDLFGAPKAHASTISSTLVATTTQPGSQTVSSGNRTTVADHTTLVPQSSSTTRFSEWGALCLFLLAACSC